MDCSWDANEFWLAGDIDAGSSIRVDDADRGSILLQRIDRPGRLIDVWNARVIQIEPFA